MKVCFCNDIDGVVGSSCVHERYVQMSAHVYVDTCTVACNAQDERYNLDAESQMDA